MLIFYSLSIIISIAGFNSLGVFITKNASATQTCTINIMRILIIWVYFVTKGEEIFYWGQLLGFVVMVTGILLYNQII